MERFYGKLDGKYTHTQDIHPVHFGIANFFLFHLCMSYFWTKSIQSEPWETNHSFMRSDFATSCRDRDLLQKSFVLISLFDIYTNSKHDLYFRKIWQINAKIENL
jgi:hypothetical protein